MDEERDIPVGVKMLADHLVKVKLEYEGIYAYLIIILIRKDKRDDCSYSCGRAREGGNAEEIHPNGRRTGKEAK